MLSRVLALGDLHIKPSNLERVNEYFETLRKILAAETPTMIVILGDTLDAHEKIHTQCLNKMLEYITLCESYATTYVLVGNHEYINNQQYLTDNHPFNGWTKNIVAAPTSVVDAGVRYVMCPYVPDGMLASTLDDKIPDWREAAAVFAHQAINGARMGAVVVKHAEPWAATLPMLVSGHLHDRQTMGNVHYPGATQPDSTEARMASLVLAKRGSPPNIVDVDIPIRLTKTVYLDAATVRGPQDVPETDGYTKYVLRGTKAEVSEARKAVKSSKATVVYKVQADNTAPLDASSHAKFTRGKMREVVESAMRSRADTDAKLALIEALFSGTLSYARDRLYAHM